MSEPEFFVLDVEATGPNLTVHSLIEIGVVRADDPEDRFHCYVRPDSSAQISQWVRDTIPNVVKAAREKGVSEEEAAGKLGAWVRERAGGKPAVMVGYVIGLDWRSMCLLFERGTGPGSNPFHYKPIDLYSLAMGTLSLPWGSTHDQMDHALGIEVLSEEKAHNALEDALQHAREFNALRKILGPRWDAVGLVDSSS